MNRYQVNVSVIEQQVADWGVGAALEEDTNASRAAVVVLSAAWVTGPDVRTLAEFTGYEWKLVSAIATRMQKSGLWEECGLTHSDHWELEDGVDLIAFWVDIAIALGLIVRERCGAEFIYRSV